MDGEKIDEKIEARLSARLARFTPYKGYQIKIEKTSSGYTFEIRDKSANPVEGMDPDQDYGTEGDALRAAKEQVDHGR
jgi:hypothetical protein